VSRRDSAALSRLGVDGIERALADLVDGPKLVRLANACGVKYPGMRTRSQARDRIQSDVARRALEDATAAREVLRLLRKESSARRRAWKRDGITDPVAALAGDNGFASEDGHVGAVAFLVADGVLEADDAAFSEWTSAGSGTGRAPSRRKTASARHAKPDSEAAATDRRAVARLEKKQTELQRKVRHQNEQLRKLRETERSLRRDLMERRGELAEARMTVERLRRERDALRNDPDPAAEESALHKSLQSVGRAVRRLGTRQKSIEEALETTVRKLDRGASPEASTTRRETVADVAALAKEVALERKVTRRAARDAGQRFDELFARVEALSEKVDGLAPARGARRTGRGKPRVGVFIDVQNVFYGARRLQGKLDFDALMEAALRGRRRIAAQAYVVETKDNDQSAFIAVLEHRAIEVRRKALQVRADGSAKGDWDMEIALDILDAAPDLDVVVLVSGDGDFTSLVRRVQAIGPRVEVLAFPRTAAKALIEVADHFQPLDRKFMIRAGASRKQPRDGATDA
jgi:uncharacterized LabA/DUF88 family protein